VLARAFAETGELLKLYDEEVRKLREVERVERQV
jgi:hypothetical protein